MNRYWHLASIALVLAAVAGLAPDALAQCSIGTASGACGNVTYEGCCTTQGVLEFCENSTLCVADCSTQPNCGWNADGAYYDCGTVGGADPSGKNPKFCSTGAACGSITYEGCCEGAVVKWCESGSLQTIDCSNNTAPKNVCGWRTDGGYYDCGGSGADPSGANPISCTGGCVAKCSGKQCGEDGCGGSCGTCPAGYFCTGAGLCSKTCTPNCTGKACGNDGCGGSCGTCPAGYGCVNGTCSKDCTPNCIGKQCGNDGCGGSCGTCPAGWSCDFSGKCQKVCTPSCQGKECGSDGCGGSCGNCPAGKSCSNGTCTGGQAGDGCSPTAVAGCGGCKCESCVCGGDAFCCDTEWDELCVQECDQDCGGNCGGACTPDCFFAECGDGGCPDQPNACGACPGGGSCISGVCQSGPLPCQPVCTGKECGNGGCADQPDACGKCTGSNTCQNGKCVTICAANCAGKQCGDDGCGGDCGKCPAGKACNGGQCTDPVVCVAKCDGKICGSDGCGGVCGVCMPPNKCNEGTGTCFDPTKCPAGCDGQTACSATCTGACGFCHAGGVCGSDGKCSGTVTPGDTGTGETKTVGPDASASPGDATGGCPPGTVLKYDICQIVSKTKTGQDGSASGGCAAGSMAPSAGVLLLFAAFAAAARSVLRFIPFCGSRRRGS